MRLTLPLVITIFILNLTDALAEEKGLESKPANKCVETRSFSITTDELSFWRSASDVAIVDVRAPEQYQRIHIPGSFNYPLFTLKTKRHLFPKRVLVLGEPYEEAPLETELEKLSKAGFSRIRYLRGGLVSWKSSGGATAGESLPQLNEITASALLRELGKSSWILIAVNCTAVDYSTKEWAGSRLLRYSPKDADVFKARAQKLILAERELRPSIAVTTCEVDSEALYRKLAPVLQEIEGEFLYFVKGGKEEMDRFQSQYRLLLARKNTNLEPEQCR